MRINHEMAAKIKYYTKKGSKRGIKGDQLVEYVRSKVYKWLAKTTKE